MNFNLKSLQNIAKYAPHRVYAALLLAAAVIIPSIGILAAGPLDRPTYTIEQPADHITFNSITNNPSWGDERNFVLVKDSADPTNANWTDTMAVTDGKEYTVKMLVHNNASQVLNLVAINTRVEATLPTTPATSQTVSGTLTADNASPQKIWDEVTLTSDKQFNVGYVPGSARFYNNVNNTTGFPLPDAIASATGTQVGYQQMDGNLQGCFQYSGFVYFKVKVYGEATPNFEMSKQVRKHVEGQTGNWQESITANAGDKIDYLVSYKNTGETQQDNVVIRDSLPAATSYVNGSTKLANANIPSGTTLSDDNITTPVGLNIGSYLPTANAFTSFSAKIAEEKDLPQCGNNVLRNTAFVETDSGTKQDTADVNVNKTCDDKASYSCDLLQATKISELEYSFNVKLSSDKATPKEVTIDFGDGQSATRDISSLPVSHKYAVAGKYTIVANASFDVNGQTVKNITSDACKVTIDTTTPVVTTAGTSAPTPTSLPSTGPVEVFGGIIGVSALGFGIQQWIASRRELATALSHK